MKTSTMVIVAAAGAGLYLLTRKVASGQTVGASIVTGAARAVGIPMQARAGEYVPLVSISDYGAPYGNAGMVGGFGSGMAWGYEK